MTQSGNKKAIWYLLPRIHLESKTSFAELLSFSHSTSMEAAVWQMCKISYADFKASCPTAVANSKNIFVHLLTDMWQFLFVG